jgi:tetratricopeptide (TPR) repeat protein
MDRGGASIRLTAGSGRAVALFVLFAASCRSAGRVEEERLVLGGRPEEPPADSPLHGHRFGHWLAVEPDPLVWPVLETACQLERAGTGEEAVQFLGRAIEDHPRSAALFEARGALYLSLGYPRAAAGDFQHAVELEPDHGETWFALGRTYQELALSRQALDALARAAALGVDTSERHLAEARAYRALGRRGLAAGRYREALERQPEPATEFLVEAASLATESRAERAASADLARALGLLESDEQPEPEETWLVRAVLQETPGESADTVAGYLHALELDGRALLDWTRLALLALELGDPETREATAQGLLALEGDPARRAELERWLEGSGQSRD